MVASTDIKFYVHTNNNAPQLQNAYGSMINVLDACLIDGIQIGVVSSLTASGNTVTATFGTAHNLMQYQVIKITGASQPEFNGEHRILTVPDVQSVTFELAAAPSATSATGTIIASLPPLGWEKPFSSSNPNGGGKAAYRSLNLLLPSRPFLRVVDELDPAYTATYAKYAKVGIVEDMTDIDTMLGVQAPFDAALPDKNWVGTGSGASAINGWAKWYYATPGMISTTADTGSISNGLRDYIVIGTKDYFYILNRSTPDSSSAEIYNYSYGFGNFKTLIPVDNANTFLSASASYAAANSSGLRGTYGGLSSNNNQATNKILLLRPYDGSAGYATARILALGSGLSSAGTYTSGSSNQIPAQSMLNLVPLFPVFLYEDNSAAIRGEINDVYWLYQQMPYTHKQIFTHNSKCFIVINSLQSNSAGSGQIVLKIGEL